MIGDSDGKQYETEYDYAAGRHLDSTGKPAGELESPKGTVPSSQSFLPPEEGKNSSYRRIGDQGEWPRRIKPEMYQNDPESWEGTKFLGGKNSYGTESVATEIERQTYDYSISLPQIEGFLKEHKIDPKAWDAWLESVPVGKSNIEDRRGGERFTDKEGNDLQDKMTNGQWLMNKLHGYWLDIQAGQVPGAREREWEKIREETGKTTVPRANMMDEEIRKTYYGKPRGEGGGGVSPVEPVDTRKGYRIYDNQSKQYISDMYKNEPSQRKRARTKAENMNLEYGAHRYSAHPIYEEKE